MKDLPPDELLASIGENRTVEFSHTFEAQIGGQLRAGLALCDFYEDRQLGSSFSKYFPVAFATNARKEGLRERGCGA